MDDTTAPTATAVAEDARTPERRDCTRCDGTQHLVGAFEGLGKYRCDTCELVVGFDLDARPAEFLISRGLPRNYSKDVFGPTLLGTERRLA
jgi:hypothetical protein